MPVNSDEEYAEDLIVDAHNRINPYISDSFPDQHRISHVIQDSQVCVEIYTKAMFKLLGLPFPEKHELNFNNKQVENFINKIIHEHSDFEHADRIPRIISLTRFWESFYGTSKYGNQGLNIRPQDVIEAEDAELALSHAQYCGETAQKLFEYISNENISEELNDVDD